MISRYCEYAKKHGLNISSRVEDENRHNQKIVDAENAKPVKNYNSKERQKIRQKRQIKEDKEKLAIGYSAKQKGKFLGEETYFNY